MCTHVVYIYIYDCALVAHPESLKGNKALAAQTTAATRPRAVAPLCPGAAVGK